MHSRYMLYMLQISRDLGCQKSQNETEMKNREMNRKIHFYSKIELLALRDDMRARNNNAQQPMLSFP